MTTKQRKRPAIPAPRHLSAEMRAWWRTVTDGWLLEPHHLHLLRSACEAWDRGQQARRLLTRDGLTTVDRYGQTRRHPAAQIEADARLAYARLLRELDLDTDGPADPDGRRPPRR